MDSVGVFLKRERELREITLEEVAKGTNISRNGLKAIEEDRFDDLPAEVFVRGFIRSYAEFIGIDPEDAILRLESTMGPGNREMNKVHRIGPGYEELKKSSRSGLVIFLSLIAVLAGLAVWYFFLSDYHGTLPGLSSSPQVERQAEKSSAAQVSRHTVQTPTILLEQELEDSNSMSVKEGKDRQQPAPASEPPVTSGQH